MVTLVAVLAPVGRALTGGGRPADLRPEPGQARSWLRHELARPAYQVDPLERLTAWLREQWQSFVGGVQDAPPLLDLALLVALLLVVVGVLVLLSRVRRDPRSGDRADAAVLGPGTTSATAHRAAADGALRDGAFDIAIVEAFRALAVRAVQRGLIEERPGLTAHELAVALRPRFPGRAEHLGRASRLFDVVFYGEQPATGQDAALVLDLETAVRDARPTRVPQDDPEPTAAVPR